MNAKNILVTGVAGMIGSHLLDRLLKEERYQVIGIDNLSVGKFENIEHQLNNPRFKFYNVDILDYDTLTVLGRDIDVIFHLAAEKKISESQSSIPTLETNTQGTKNILNVAKKWNSKVIFASTSDVYGMSPDLPLREDGDLLLGPSMIRRWSYAVSKLYGEQLAFAYYQSYKLPVVVLRYFGGFSPRSSFSWSGGHVPIFINAILRNEAVTIHGDGSQTRSMAFVEDLVEGTFRSMLCEKAVGQIINVGNDEELSVLDTAKLIHEIAKMPEPLKVDLIPMDQVFGQYKDIMRRIPDLTKARELLGYEPKFKLRESIKLTVEEVRKNL
jgi:UDP-glucose 4-epimerase